MNDVPLFETWEDLAALLPPFLIRCGAAALCGAMIGLERERNLLALFAAVMVLLTLVVLGRFEERFLDPSTAKRAREADRHSP